MIARVLCVSALAAVLWTGTAVPGEKKPFTADRHKENKVTCQGCHGVDKPETPATEKACLACHKSLEGVAGRTENRQPNPHKNHLTESSDIECMHCHRGHKADALICHQCHTGLEFEKQGAETKQSIPAE